MQDFGFNWLDNTIVAILAISIIMGIWRGLMREIMSVLVWVLATVVAILFSPMAGQYLDTTVTQPEAQIGVSFLILFVVSYLVGMLLRHLFLKVMGSEPSLKGRLLGGIFGAARGILFITVIGFLLAFTTFSQDEAWQQSRLIPMVQKVDTTFINIMPDNTAELLKNIITPVQEGQPVKAVKSQVSTMQNASASNDTAITQAF